MDENKKKTGYGTCMFGKCEYTGEFVDGIRQGYGVMRFANYDIYDPSFNSFCTINPLR